MSSLCAVAGIKKAVAEHNPKIVFLTSPNNPDGSMTSTEDLLVSSSPPCAVPQASTL